MVNDDYGRDGARVFGSVFKALGGTFLDGDYFTQDDLSMRNQISKVLASKPDFLLVIGRDRALATVCKQIREVNKEVKIVGVNAFDAKIVWDPYRRCRRRNCFYIRLCRLCRESSSCQIERVISE